VVSYHLEKGIRNTMKAADSASERHKRKWY